MSKLAVKNTALVVGNSKQRLKREVNSGLLQLSPLFAASSHPPNPHPPDEEVTLFDFLLTMSLPQIIITTTTKWHNVIQT